MKRRYTPLFARGRDARWLAAYYNAMETGEPLEKRFTIRSGAWIFSPGSTDPRMLSTFASS